MLSIKLAEKKDGNPTEDYCSVSVAHEPTYIHRIRNQKAAGVTGDRKLKELNHWVKSINKVICFWKRYEQSYAVYQTGIKCQDGTLAEMMMFLQWQMAEGDLSFLDSAEDQQCKESVSWGDIGKNWRGWKEDAGVSGIFVFLVTTFPWQVLNNFLEERKKKKEEEKGQIFICFTTREIHKWKPFFSFKMV